MDTLIGPFSQIVTMDHLSLYGPISDESMEILKQGGVMVDEKGQIKQTGKFTELRRAHDPEIEEVQSEAVLLPGFIDSHTHLCYAGSRSGEYAMRLSGLSYQEIMSRGGGIMNTVKRTRDSSFQELYRTTLERVNRHLAEGVTSMEIKSGYGLTLSEEMKMLEVIRKIGENSPADMIPTCLAAHFRPPEFDSDTEYLKFILHEVLPVVKAHRLANRIDIFIEKNAFSPADALPFLEKAHQDGFSITVHADQFSAGGSEVACRAGAVSADHLEAITPDCIRQLADHDVVATVLPGASLGLGMPFAPARALLDAGTCLAIATDWNPGSAPMGDLLAEASLLSAQQQLSFSETCAGITFRAARALGLGSQGRISARFMADMIAFPTDDYREVLYHQGKLKPNLIWKKGKKINKTASS